MPVGVAPYACPAQQRQSEQAELRRPGQSLFADVECVLWSGFHRRHTVPTLSAVAVHTFIHQHQRQIHEKYYWGGWVDRPLSLPASTWL